MHCAPQAVIGLGRLVEPRQERRVGFGAHGEDGAVEQRLFSRVPGGFQYEIGPGLAGKSGGALDQPAFRRLDAQVQGVAARRRR